MRFGPPTSPGATTRPGAYAIIVDEAWLVAVVHVDGGVYRPRSRAMADLTHEAQRWVVRRALGPC